MSNSPTLQARMSSQDHHGVQVPQLEPVTCVDESYTKNTLGERLDFPLGNLYKVAVTIHPTKRNVIGLSASMYDPMGILSFWTVCFKLLLCSKIRLG